MRTTNKRFFLLLFICGILTAASVKASVSLEIIPGTFDFGWCPDNAQVTAEFRIKNTGAEVVPLTSVQPTCGCTASSFTPGDLASNEESVIALTFNTRGYAGSKFNKLTRVKAGSPEAEYSVTLAGHVLNPDSKIVPVENGVASFEPNTEASKKIISIQNKTGQKVALTVIQKPAGWAKAKLLSNSIDPNGTADLEVKVEKPYDAVRHTSITLEAVENNTPHRLTVAIRTGAPAPVLRPLPPPQATQMLPPAPVSPPAKTTEGEKAPAK